MADKLDTSLWWFNCVCVYVWVSLCVRGHDPILLGAWWMAIHVNLTEAKWRRLFRLTTNVPWLKVTSCMHRIKSNRRRASYLSHSVTNKMHLLNNFVLPIHEQVWKNPLRRTISFQNWGVGQHETSRPYKPTRDALDRVWRYVLRLVMKTLTNGALWLNRAVMSDIYTFMCFQSKSHTPSIFNIFLAQTKTNASEGFIGSTISVGRRKQIPKLRGSHRPHITVLIQRKTYSSLETIDLPT